MSSALWWMRRGSVIWNASSRNLELETCPKEIHWLFCFLTVWFASLILVWFLDSKLSKRSPKEVQIWGSTLILQNHCRCVRKETEIEEANLMFNSLSRSLPVLMHSFQTDVQQHILSQIFHLPHQSLLFVIKCRNKDFSDDLTFVYSRKD